MSSNGKMVSVFLSARSVSTKIRYVVVIFLVSSVSTQGVDRTREPEASGSEVVKATVALILDTRIFPNDNGFLRRLAYVESKDGTDPKTYSRADYHGGIWQVDEYIFRLTKSASSAVRLHDLINDRFEINWRDVQWVDLRKPLYSGLAASLFFTIIEDPIPHISDINGQAAYWKEHYDDGSGTKEDFVAALEDLKRENCHTARLDVAFVVDGSGSIKSDPFNIAKDFVVAIVDNFDVGPNSVRFGFIQYENDPTIEFSMNQYMEKGPLQTAISNISYGEGGTQTGKAINDMVSKLFGDGYGARDTSENVPRIGIVMTDGRSYDEVSEPAEAARAAGITLFAIGIGPGVDDEELHLIANDPDEKYVFQVQDFDVIDNIRSEISLGTCDEPAQPGIGEKLNGTLNSASKVYLETKVPPSKRVTFSLTATGGKVTAYLSTMIRNPNEAFHQWSVEATEKNPLAQVFIDATLDDTRKKRQVADDHDHLVLYGTVINEASTPAPDTTTAPGTETVFSVWFEEGDTRIITTTTQVTTTTTTTTTTKKSEPAAKMVSDAGLSAGVIAGISVALLVVVLLVLAFVLVFLIKRRRAEKDGPNLLSRGRNESVISTMSAEMRRQSNTTNIYGTESGPSTSGRDVGMANGGMVGDMTYYPVKPGRMEKESKPDNVYTFGDSANNGVKDDDDIYVVSEFNTMRTAPQDDVYEVTAIGQDDVYEIREFP